MSVSGLVEAAAAFGALKELFGMDEALKEAAELVAEDARRRCKSSEVAGEIVVNKIEGGYEVRVENERAAVEEFGTGPREGMQGPHNFPARPYFRPAIDENVDNVQALLTKHFEGAAE